MCAPSRRATGFTLVELVIVVTIIGLLTALVLPAVQMARDSARRAQCQSNLRQLGIAMALHANAKGAFPVGCLGYRGDFTAMPPVRARFIAWNVWLLPFVEEEAVFDAIDTSVPSYEAVNKPAAATVIRLFLCPSTEEPELRNPKGAWKGSAFSDYGGIYGVEGPMRARGDVASVQTIRDDSLGVLLYEEPVAPREVVDGLTKTACIAETVVRRETECEWINGQNIFAHEERAPMNVERSAGGEIGSQHPDGASLAFCDGHVEFVAESIEQAVLNAMLTKAGGE